MTSLLASEIDRQTDRLLSLGLLTHPDQVAPLRAGLAERVTGDPRPSREHAPFLLVATASPPSAQIALVTRRGRAGAPNQHFTDLDDFAPVVPVPEAPVYAVLDVERGDDLRGVTPADAVVALEERGRTPLTMLEGLALLHAVPEALEPNHCFHTGASRGTDRRVPAIWISRNAPTLGWCWEQNHHTWLGYASTGGRLAP